MRAVIFIISAFLLLMRPAAAQSWFSGNPVSCSLSNEAINLGVFSRITDVVPVATGDWGVQCSSNAYPSGFPSNYYTAEGAYCVVIAGSSSGRVLRGQGKNSNITIPFNFYFSRQKAFGPGWQQDYDSPIGDGTWGIAYIDWNYANGDPNMANRSRPRQSGRAYPLPGRGRFDLKLAAPAAGIAYPSGIYSAQFPFRWRTGTTQSSGQYPAPSAGPGVCSRFPGSGGSGTISVRLEIKKYCNVTVKSSINFGPQALLDKVPPAEGQISAECSEGTQFGISIGAGLNDEGTGQRAMKHQGGDEKILYELYQNKALTQPWKNDWSGSSIVRGTGTGGEHIYPVYAALLRGQSGKPAGLYKDTLIVEIKVMDTGG